jgi:regulator of protease activity HflC (stomatin/prohibitin superfamily)
MNWLQQIFHKILALFPMTIILTSYEAGVLFTFGKYAKAKGPGWYVVWPVIHKFVFMEVQTQVVDLRTQSIRTKDEKDVVISGAIQYSIRDVKKAICNVQNVDVSLETLALGIILEFVNNKTLKECHSSKDLKTEILKGMREAAQGWGVKIEKVYITDFGSTRNIRLLSNPTEKV